jgi:protein DJ-1
MATVLVVLAPGAEEIETMAVGDILVRAGQQVTVASTVAGLTVTGSRGLPLAAHTTLDAVLHAEGPDPDLVYLPGGMGSALVCREDPRIQNLIGHRLAAQQRLAIICASVTALVPHGHGRGRRVTSYPGVRAQVEPHVGAWLDQAVVEDGCLVTSQGPGTAIALGLTLARLLAGAATAATVAAAMLVAVPGDRILASETA